MSIAGGPIGGAPSGASANANYALPVTNGTFTLSMRGAGKLITDIYPTGTFVLDGKAVGMTAQRPANFDTGAFTYIGQNVSLDQNFGLIIDTVYNNSQFTYTGQNVVFEKGFGMVLTSEPFTSTGQNINFTKQMNVDFDSATFTLTGQDAFKGVGEAFAVGTFTYTGQDVTMFAGRFLRPETGIYTYSFATDIKTRGWFSPTVAPTIWTDAA